MQRREAGLPRATSGLPRAGDGPATASASSWLDAQPFSLHVAARDDAPASADAPTSAAAPIAAVQLHADGSDAPDADTVHAHAQRGLTGPAQPLPHLDRIQQSFGQAHDVAGIGAHVGGPATEAAAAIGASAYASGNAVAFASSPDLHTAAHEAAHVVQQRSGVSLYGGVGQAGDAYEQHADAVADRVVAGQSAADLLAPYAGNSGATTAIQRQPAPPGGGPPGAAIRAGDSSTDDYLGRHWEHVRAGVTAEFARQAERWLTARLAWGVGPDVVAAHAVDLLLPTLYMPGFLGGIVDHADELVAGARAVGGAASAASTWNPAVGRALGRDLGGDLGTAMRTMSADYARALAAHGARAPGEVLHPTTRFERVAVELLEHGKARLAQRRQTTGAARSDTGGHEEVLGPAHQVGTVAPGSGLTFEPANPLPVDADPRDAQRSTLRSAEAAQGYADAGGPGSALAVDTARARFEHLDASDPTAVDLDARIDTFLLRLATLSQNLRKTAGELFASDKTIGHVAGLPWVARAETLARALVAVEAPVDAVRRRLVGRLAVVPADAGRQRLLAEAQTDAAARISAAKIVELSESAIATLRTVEEAGGVIFSINMMIASIAMSFVATEVGAVITADLLSALARTSLTGVSLGAARGSAVVAGQVVEAYLNAAFQHALSGDDTGAAFAENVLTSLLAQGGARAIGAGAAAQGVGEAGRAGRLGVGVGQAAVGAGAGLVAGAVVQGRDAPADHDLIIQGVSLAFGHWLSRRLAAAKEHVARLDGTDAAELRRRIDHLTGERDKLLAADAPVGEAQLTQVVAEAHDVLVAAERGAAPAPAETSPSKGSLATDGGAADPAKAPGAGDEHRPSAPPPDAPVELAGADHVDGPSRVDAELAHAPMAGGTTRAHEAWLSQVAEGLSPEETSKLVKMTKGKTLEQQRATFGGGDVEAARAKVRAAVRSDQEAAAMRGRSKERYEELKQKIDDLGLLNDPDIRKLLELPESTTRKLSDLRDKVMAKLLKAEAQAAHPDAQVLDNVKIYEKQAEKTRDEWRNNRRLPDGSLPHGRGLVDIDGVLYLQRGELDLLIIERPTAGGKAKIVKREEIKTGHRDNHADAKSQLMAQAELLSAGASGQKSIRLFDGEEDLTDTIDLASDATAEKATRGPADKKFNKSLGITAIELEKLIKGLSHSPRTETSPP
ncbi:MAG: DUF4157 domain-containing protein [Kofleriaceae bacterium]